MMVFQDGYTIILPSPHLKFCCHLYIAVFHRNGMEKSSLLTICCIFQGWGGKNKYGNLQSEKKNREA